MYVHKKIHLCKESFRYFIGRLYIDSSSVLYHILHPKSDSNQFPISLNKRSLFPNHIEKDEEFKEED